MPLRLIFRRDARTELRAAVRWYEERRRGLGERFKAAVQAALDRITADPTDSARYTGRSAGRWLLTSRT
jgi:hypothetical protein